MPLSEFKELVEETQFNVEAKPAVKIRPSKLVGYVRDPDTFFAEEKRRIWEKVGDLSEYRVTSNRILVAMWTTQQDYQTETPGKLVYAPDTYKDENKWQGRTALVLKLGPKAFRSDEEVLFAPEEIAEVGDWVVCRPSDGVRFRFWDGKYEQECVLLESERGIRMIMPRPDPVW